MSSTYTPAYRIEFKTNLEIVRSRFRISSPMAWDCKRDGLPTAARLEKWRVGMNKSFQPGGVNFYADADAIPHISHAKVVHQATGRIVCETVMPMFEVV